MNDIDNLKDKMKAFELNEKDEERRIKIYKRLGKKMFKELDAQDNRKPEYVKQ